MANLTDPKIKGLKAGAAVVAHKGDYPGLSLEVRPSGAKVFLWKGRKPDGSAAKLTLGTWPGFSLGEANDRAKALKEAKTAGLWLPDVEAMGEAEAKAEEAAAAVVAERQGVQTFDWFWTNHYEPAHVAILKGDGPAETNRLYARKIKPYIGDMALNAIDHDTLAQIVADCAKTARVTANRIATLLGTIFKRALMGNLRSITLGAGLRDNPALYLSKPTKEQARERVLDRAELGVVLSVVERWAAMTPAYGTAATITYAKGLKLILATGCRREEAFGAVWGQFDLEAGEWLQPAGVTKNGQPNLLVLPPDLLAWLRALKPEGAKPTDYVFPAGRADAQGRPFSGFSKSQDHIIAHCVALADKVGVKIDHWTRHDLRRTVSTELRGIRAPGSLMPMVPDAVVEALLNHISGGARAGVAAVYNRYRYVGEKAEALIVWRDYLNRALDAQREREKLAEAA